MAVALAGSVLRGVFVGGFLGGVLFGATMLLVHTAGVTPVAFAAPVLIAVFVAAVLTLRQLPRHDALLRVDVDRSPEPTRIRLVRPFRRTWRPIGELRAVTITERRVRPAGANLPEVAGPSEVTGLSEPAGEGSPEWEDALPYGVTVTLTGPGGRSWAAPYISHDRRVSDLDTADGRAPAPVAAQLAARFTTMLDGTPAVVQHERHWVDLPPGKGGTSSWFSGGSASANSGAIGGGC